VTTISFALPDDGSVELRIFDILGREVAVLVNDNLRKGEYKYVYDAGVLSSGIYFYTLRSEKYSETKKMILIK
jgi:hypothetical protein